jgi:hypothetical protein
VKEMMIDSGTTTTSKLNRTNGNVDIACSNGNVTRMSRQEGADA